LSILRPRPNGNGDKANSEVKDNPETPIRPAILYEKKITGIRQGRKRTSK